MNAKRKSSRKPLSREWAKGEKLGREFARGLRGGASYTDAIATLDKAMRKYPDAWTHGMVGFCDGIAKQMWRRQRRAELVK